MTSIGDGWRSKAGHGATDRADAVPSWTTWYLRTIVAAFSSLVASLRTSERMVAWLGAQDKAGSGSGHRSPPHRITTPVTKSRASLGTVCPFFEPQYMPQRKLILLSSAFGPAPLVTNFHGPASSGSF